MARVTFNADCADPRPGQEGIVYGAGHETDFQDEDVAWLQDLRTSGKVRVTDISGLTPESLATLGLTPPA